MCIQRIGIVAKHVGGEDTICIPPEKEAQPLVDEASCGGDDLRDGRLRAGIHGCQAPLVLGTAQTCTKEANRLNGVRAEGGGGDEWVWELKHDCKVNEFVGIEPTLVSI
jgi:hypothetical protein